MAIVIMGAGEERARCGLEDRTAYWTGWISIHHNKLPLVRNQSFPHLAECSALSFLHRTQNLTILVEKISQHTGDPNDTAGSRPFD